MRVSNMRCFINDYISREMGFRKRVACGTVESLTRAGDPARDGMGDGVIRRAFSAGAVTDVLGGLLSY